MFLNRFFSSLRRVTSKGDFIPEIDGLRFLAIVPVVLMHANTNFKREHSASVDLGIFNHLVTKGGLGVWVFFAISGFILSYAFAKHFHLRKQKFGDLNLRSYYWRRVTRLEPPFLISTLILYFFTGLIVVGDLSALFPNLLATLTYSHYLIYGEWSTINPVTWSLEAEIQFYLLAPFLSALLFSINERLRNALLIVLIIAVPYLTLGSDNSIFVSIPNLSRTIPVYFSHFMVGILMASIYTGSFWTKIKNNKYVYDVICILSIGCLFSFIPKREHLFTYYIFDLCVLLIMISSFKGKIVNIIFSHPVVTSIGGMCYSIYLIHYAVLFAIMKMTKGITFSNTYINYTFHMLLSLLCVMVFSIVFYKYCEKPFMYKDWPKRLSRYFTKEQNRIN